MITICIPVYNNYPILKRCVDAVHAYTDSPYELIIIDDGSTDKAIAEYGQAEADVFIRHEQNVGNVVGRYEGSIIASHNYIAQLDCDTIVTPHWDVKLVQTLADDETIGAVSALLACQTGYIMSSIYKVECEYNDDDLIDIESLSFACMMYTKTLGITPNPGLYNHKTDREFSFRILRAGKRLVINTKVMVYHPNWVTHDGNWVKLFPEGTREDVDNPTKRAQAERILLEENII
ncbi:glycosyltransferase family 2 protein [bacterium]|nr:glycosyltransferase family 2 protein [bacterium]